MELELLSAALPFLGEELLAEDVRYSGLGVTLQGRDAYAAATAAWSRVLPQRLGRLQCERKTVLPPDSRRRVTARYSLEFEAPLPLSSPSTATGASLGWKAPPEVRFFFTFRA